MYSWISELKNNTLKRVEEIINILDCNEIEIDNEIKDICIGYKRVIHLLERSEQKEVAREARTITEAICKHLYSINIGQYREKIMLDELIRKLKKHDVIHGKDEIYFDVIKKLGNIASHYQEKVQNEMTMEDAQFMVNRLEYIINLYLDKIDIILSDIRSKYSYNKGNDIEDSSIDNILGNKDIKCSIDSDKDIENNELENKKNREYEKQIYDKKVDEELWNIVLKNNNLENYMSYIEGCTIKLHLDEAKKRVEDIIKNNQDIYYKKDMFDEVKKQLELQRNLYSSKYYEASKEEKPEKIKVKQVNDINTTLNNTNFGKKPQNNNSKSDINSNKSLSIEETRKLAAKYYEDKDRKSAYILYERLANANDLESIKMMAHIYTVGDKVDINYEKAFQWYEKGSKLGDSDCLLAMAFMIKRGEGVVKNEKLAIRLFYTAANKGNDIAKLHLKRIDSWYSK